MNGTSAALVDPETVLGVDVGADVDEFGSDVLATEGEGHVERKRAVVKHSVDLDPSTQQELQLIKVTAQYGNL